MTVRITVKNIAANATMRMEVEPQETMADVIQCAAEYWSKDSGAYILKKGKTMLRGDRTAEETGLVNDDVLELIPDPEGGGNGTA
ncbi:MAG: hypothetical protein RBQ77_01870 [Candidatus Methanomethylophilaceae archaeon]|jgi:hypothetical protein|nr:hypothetical protein [Candidatus Methanomethylophilaceae archaeon]NLF34213.1 hypothetical protein [Thermoplasmatales archaeon]